MRVGGIKIIVHHSLTDGQTEVIAEVHGNVLAIYEAFSYFSTKKGSWLFY